jgi:flavin-dependent dehydrogenase
MAARELARGGARVLLVEKENFPREKVCGGCLNGQALAVLQRSGLESLPNRSGGVPLRTFRLGVHGREFRLTLPPSIAVPRGPFDAELVRAAAESGVLILPRTDARVDAPRGASRRVRLRCGRDVRIVEARVVLVATGLGRSCMAADCGPVIRIARSSKIGIGTFVDHAPPEYESGTIHMAVSNAGYVGLVRIGDGRLHVAGAIRTEALSADGGPGAAAGRILGQAGFAPVTGLRSTRWRGTTGLTRRTSPIAEERLFILGDAAGYIEPFTGEGIAWALAAGQAIGPLALRAIERWEPRSPREWEQLHARVVRRRQIACRAAAVALRHPRLVRVAIEALSRLPACATRLVDHLNAPPCYMEMG